MGKLAWRSYEILNKVNKNREESIASSIDNI